MASSIELSALILETACFGTSLVTSVQFSDSRAGAEQLVEDMFSAASDTASYLTSLGNIIGNVEQIVPFNGSGFRPAIAACKKDFQRLEIALGKAKGKTNGVDGVVCPNLGHSMIIALGGVDEVVGLMVSMEASKSTLLLLSGFVNFLLLERLKKKPSLNEDQAENLKLFAQQLSSLPNSVQKARLIDSAPARFPLNLPKEFIAQHTSAASKDARFDSTSASAPVLEIVGEHIYTTLATAGPGMNNKFAADWLGNITEGSDTLVGDGEDEAEMTKESKVSESSIGIDAESFHSSSHDSIDDPWLYEGWLLENKTYIPGPTIVKFCGLKMKVCRDSNTYKDDYTMTPKTLDRAELKLMIHVAESNSANPRVTFLEALGPDARTAVEKLLEDRNRKASQPYSWMIAAIFDTNVRRNLYVRKNFWGKKVEDKNYSPRWMIVLKGGLHDPVIQKPLLPDRDSDPWAPGNIYEASMFWTAKRNSCHGLPSVKYLKDDIYTPKRGVWKMQHPGEIWPCPKSLFRITTKERTMTGNQTSKSNVASPPAEPRTRYGFSWEEDMDFDQAAAIEGMAEFSQTLADEITGSSSKSLAD